MKIVKVPTCFASAISPQNSILLNGLSVIESCTHTHGHKHGSMFLEDHLLLYVRSGTYVATHGKMRYEVNKNEMVLLKKAILIDFDKHGDPNNNNLFEYMMFFLKDEFLKDFVKMANIPSVQIEEQVKITVKPVKERLLRFFESIRPYFAEPENIDGGLVKLKMMELLYDIASTDKNLLQELLQLKQQANSDITKTVEDNFINPVSLTELAYLSGRSLSSFKRDFQAIYQVPPAQWIREKRLHKANELLANTAMAVSDICYASGFENLAHFSRIYKEYFGFSPSTKRQPTQMAEEH